MDRVTILKTKKCDLTRLSLDAREASVLARVDGRLTLEEIAELACLDFGSTARLARHLLELGAVELIETQPVRTRVVAKGKKPLIVEEDARTVARADPRAEGASIRPGRPSRAMTLKKHSKAAMRVPTKSTVPPTRKPSKTSLPPRKPSTPPRKLSVPAAVAAAAPKKSERPKPKPTRSERSMRVLHRAAREITVQARLDLLLKAAEESLMSGDFASAATNYRLALEHRDDPVIRSKLDEVDAQAKTLRFTRNVTQARVAERAERWVEAASLLEQAHKMRASADLADRAAQAIVRSEGDLERASALAQEAVNLDGENAGYRVTLAEVLFRLNRNARAEEEVSAALDIAPNDARARALLSLIAKRRKR